MVVLAMVSALGSSVVATADGGASSQASGLIRRASVASLATDSSEALRDCDPTHPVDGDFEVRDVVRADTPGLGAQVFSGLVANRCNAPVAALALAVSGLDSHGTEVADAVIRPEFGLLPPATASPFSVIFAANLPAVSRLEIDPLPWTTPVEPLPLLQIAPGTTATSGATVTLAYTLKNAGDGPAILPAVSGRMVGTNCADPFATVAVNSSNRLNPGQSISDSLTLPADCQGVVQLFAGGEAPPDPPLPAGFSVRGAQTTYTADGVLHLLALLCNNHADDFFLFPAPTIEFSGAETLRLKVFDSGFYPSGACQPFVVSVPNAPPGLSFNKLVSIDTGEGDRQPLNIENPLRGPRPGRGRGSAF